MNMDDFYIVLPSNATEGNTPSSFLTTLRNPVLLDNPEEWAVGLLEINFKNALKTIYNDSVEVDHTVINFTPSIVDQTVAVNTNFHHVRINWTWTNIYEGTHKMTYFFVSPPLHKTEETVLITSSSQAFNNVPDVQLKYIPTEGKIQIKNNTPHTIHLKMPHFYMLTLGLIKNTNPKEQFSMRKMSYNNLPPGTSWAPYTPYVITLNTGKSLVTQPANNITHEPRIEYPTFDIDYNNRTITTTKVTSLAPLPGKYMTGKNLAKQFVNAKFNEYFKLEYDERLNRFKVTPVKQDDTNNIYTIKFVGGLHEVLGFKELEYTSSEIGTSGKESDLQLDLDRGITNIFIYCDVCEHVRVGNASAPLLRPIAFNSHKYGDMVHTHFVNPMYVPVNKSFIDTIEIKMCDATGEIIGFVEGLTTIILHFKRT